MEPGGPEPPAPKWGTNPRPQSRGGLQTPLQHVSSRGGGHGSAN